MILGWGFIRIGWRRPAVSDSFGGGRVFSSSSMICSTRLPRTTESSITKRSVGVYFRTTARATRPWMRLRWRVSKANPRFCWSGVAEDADEHDGGMQIAGDIHVIDGDQAGLADREFAADGFADLALQQFAHALESEGRHGIRIDG